mgnify:CR=1 FL=1|tara:strand:- start:2467 stop:3510 length:1044 start_codon:yes stop_codon:yes gene_type:complete
MKIVWLSSRVLGNDLCSTTQFQLANGLVAKGHAVDLYSPGYSVGNTFSHHSIKRSKRRGFQASSIVKNLGNRIDEINLADVVLIDWPIFAITKKIKPPVILMDRSPPADSGFLAMLQWKPWYKAWSNAIRGTTVSSAHSEFVVDETQTPQASIGVIPAGVDLDLFQSRQKDGPIKLAYHGRVDMHRGVMSLPMILSGLRSEGIDATLHIHGTGNAVKRLRKIKMQGLEVTGAVPQGEIADLLSNYDIGLLPMPEYKIWNIASPLKRCEYLASGMVICGVDHAGHQIEGSGDWLQLFSEEQFISGTVAWIKSLDRESLSVLQKESRAYAEKNSSWSHSVDALESIILS